MNVVLPAPFGPISPTSWPCLDADVDGVDGPHAPEANGKAGRGEDGAHAPLAGSDSASSVFRFARACAVR